VKKGDGGRRKERWEKKGEDVLDKSVFQPVKRIIKYKVI
jgi:hypothetical protein